VAPDSNVCRRIGAELAAIAEDLGPTLGARIKPVGIRKALRRALRKTMEWHTRAEEEGLTDAFHAWRRWQKRLELQLRLTAPEPSPKLARQLDRLHDLQEQLGALHDIDQLVTRFAAKAVVRRFGVEHWTRVDQLLKKRQLRLRRQVLRTAKKALHEKLERHVAAVGKLWAASHPRR